MTQALSPVEQIKATINPYAAADVFTRLAAGTVADITPEDDVVMRWHGLYRHRPHEAGLFMLRLKLPNGQVTPAQLRALAQIAARHDFPYVNLTTRQDLQLYGLTLAELPEVFAALAEVGLTSLGACGDVVRNVIGCPVAGLAPNEPLDILPTVQALTEAYLGNPAFANLPRKFKIAVSGCPDGCVPARINDVGLVAAQQADGRWGYALLVGGGLSTAPRAAEDTGAWVAPEQVVEVVTRIVEIFRDYGNREQRHQARVKHLLAARGMAWFRAELAARLGWALPALPPEAQLLVRHGDHLGVQPQRQAGRVYIGIPVPAGRLRVDQLAALADLADAGQGALRVTHHQNLVLTDVPAASADAVLARLAALGLPVDASAWSGLLVVCPGKQVCMKALVHTKDVAATLLGELATLPGEGISLHVSGCPNGCGQHAIADLGLQGVLAKGEAGAEERFDLWAGGDGQVFARRIAARLRAEELPAVLQPLLARYRRDAHAGEPFSAYARRVLWAEGSATDDP